MALQKRERYGCPEQDCGCEIELTKAAASTKGETWIRATVAVRRCRCSRENYFFQDSIGHGTARRPMLQNWHVGLGYYCALLLNASARFCPGRSWVNIPDAIFGLPSRASVCRILDGRNLRLDAGRPDRQAQVIVEFEHR